MAEHDVEIDPEALDAELDAAAGGEPGPTTGDPGQFDLVESPRESWLGVARMAAGMIASALPNWEIPEEQTEANAQAIARVLAAWGPNGPGDPESWNPWLHLAYAAAVTIGAHGIAVTKEGPKLKPPRPPDIQAERHTDVDDDGEPRGQGAGFSTVAD